MSSQSATRERCLPSPELQSSHVLTATDRLSCAVVSCWTSLYGPESLEKQEDFQKATEDARQKAIRGTFSDLVDKEEKKESHHHRVFNVQNILVARY